MSGENKNHFQLNRVFTNVNAILDRKAKSIKDITANAIFMLDANSLLAPFQTGKEDIDRISKVYRKLISEQRLFIPEHALREFAKNRSTKISELFTNIDTLISTAPSIKSIEYPILGELESYKNLQNARAEILDILKRYKLHLTELKDDITNWNWSDPVTNMYSKIFNEQILIVPDEEEKKLSEEYIQRIADDIPPGNKDKSKDFNAIGDFVIWKCILKMGKEKKKDIVFVSNDEKNDWLLKGNKASISTKYELVHEFYEFTGGNNFICMNFPAFMEAQGLQLNIVESFNIEEFFELNTKNISESEAIHSLQKVKLILESFLEDCETDHDTNYIEEDIKTPIRQFFALYESGYFNSQSWASLHLYIGKFVEILPQIVGVNSQIEYHEHRMKRSTDALKLRLIELSHEFLSHFETFYMLT